MEFSRLLLLLLLCLVVSAWAHAAAADVPAAARAPRSPAAGCPTRCGDIDVPYPFGLEPQCAINSGFHLHCNTTAIGSTRLVIKGRKRDLEVTKISVRENKLWVKTHISRQCFNNQSRNNNGASVNITGTPFVLSADDNNVIVLGCKTLAYMRSDTVSNNLHIPLFSLSTYIYIYQLSDMRYLMCMWLRMQRSTQSVA
jgi:hypothetical protein